MKNINAYIIFVKRNFISISRIGPRLPSRTAAAVSCQVQVLQRAPDKQSRSSNRQQCTLGFNLAIFHFILTTFLNMKSSPRNLQSRFWRTTVRIIVRPGGRLSEYLFVVEDGFQKTVHVEDKSYLHQDTVPRPRKCLSSRWRIKAVEA